MSGRKASRIWPLGLSCLLMILAVPLSAQTYRVDAAEDLSNKPVRILQTNSAGDNVHVIDPERMEIVGVIEDIPHNHGVALHADGNYYYITNEHDSTVDVVDTRTLDIVDRVDLVARPNNLSASDRARKVYVAISGAPWVQVIDMDTNEIVANIPTPGGVHNTFVTPDGRFAVAGMIGAATMSVIDTETDEIVWEVDFSGEGHNGRGNGVRPITFDTWPDGRTRRAFVQITGWHGFWVVDWEEQRVVDKISPPAIPVSEMVADGIQGAASHGAVILPDQTELWISSRATGNVFGYTLPDLEYIGRVSVGNPAWLTADVDNRHIWVGISSDNQSAKVDTETLEVVRRFPVGQAPKRIYTAVFPAGWGGETTRTSDADR